MTDNSLTIIGPSATLRAAADQGISATTDSSGLATVVGAFPVFDRTALQVSATDSGVSQKQSIFQRDGSAFQFQNVGGIFQVILNENARASEPEVKSKSASASSKKTALSLGTSGDLNSYPGIAYDAGTLSPIAQEIFAAGEGRNGTDEMTFLNRISGRTAQGLTALARNYFAQFGSQGASPGLTAASASEFDFEEILGKRVFASLDRGMGRDDREIYLARLPLLNAKHEDLFMSLATTYNLAQDWSMHRADMAGLEPYRQNASLNHKLLAQVEATISRLTRPGLDKTFSPEFNELLVQAATQLFGVAAVLEEEQRSGSRFPGAASQATPIIPGFSVGSALGTVRLAAEQLARQK